jgi:hypothetical protein
MIRDQYGEARPLTEQDEQFMVAMRYFKRGKYGNLSN